MSWAKGAVSRHLFRSLKKKSRTAKFGSRRAYRRTKKGNGGKGMSWF